MARAFASLGPNATYTFETAAPYPKTSNPYPTPTTACTASPPSTSVAAPTPGGTPTTSGGNITGMTTNGVHTLYHYHPTAFPNRLRMVAGTGAATAFHAYDRNGSATSVGGSTLSYDYLPYGGILASSGTEQTRFRFTGHERDGESGLDYMLERSYAYGIGRFLRPTPCRTNTRA